MIPATPITEEVRLPKYVQEEWNTILNKVAPGAVEGWKSILYMNYAIINRGEAFRQLLSVPLDNGVSRAWALVCVFTLSSSIILLFPFSSGLQHDPMTMMALAQSLHQQLIPPLVPHPVLL